MVFTKKSLTRKQKHHCACEFCKWKFCGLVKQFVKILSEWKLKEGVCRFLHTENSGRVIHLRQWRTQRKRLLELHFKPIALELLDNKKDPACRNRGNMLLKFEEPECNMSQKLHFSILAWVFPENLWSVSEEHGKQFHPRYYRKGKTIPRPLRCKHDKRLLLVSSSANSGQVS